MESELLQYFGRFDFAFSSLLFPKRSELFAGTDYA